MDILFIVLLFALFIALSVSKSKWYLIKRIEAISKRIRRIRLEIEQIERMKKQKLTTNNKLLIFKAKNLAKKLKVLIRKRDKIAIALEDKGYNVYWRS